MEELIENHKKFSKMVVKPCAEVKGEVTVSGSKNSALPLLASALLVEELILENFPLLLDTLYALKILKILGKDIELNPTLKRVRIYGEIKRIKVPYELSSRFRGSILFLGGLLGAGGKAVISHPGGCAIGARPIDQHLKFLSHLGANLTLKGGYINASLPKEVKNSNFVFDVVTVTGTENALLTLAGLEGEFTLENVALEPEVFDLLDFLRKLGIKILTHGRTLKISVPPKGGLKRRLTHRVIPDRIEAGTFLVLGSLLGNPLKVSGLNTDHLGVLLEKLEEAGVTLKILTPTEVEVFRSLPPKGLFIETAPYPGFPTDMQAQFMAMLSVARGSSVIVEKIFENRFQHALELVRMGANIKIKGNTAVIEGVKKLVGAPVKATDLRASASLVIAGLIAEGQTEISEIYHLLRGYEDMDKKLTFLGCHAELI